MIPVPSYTWDEARFVYESMFLVGREALKRGYDVILDATFLREDYREEARERLSRHYSSATVVWVSCEQETARARNASRNSVVPEESFNRLASTFERPRRAIVVDSGKRDPESSAKYVLGKLPRSRGAR
jgi:predicted kinase